MWQMLMESHVKSPESPERLKSQLKTSFCEAE